MLCILRNRPRLSELGLQKGCGFDSWRGASFSSGFVFRGLLASPWSLSLVSFGCLLPRNTHPWTSPRRPRSKRGRAENHANAKTTTAPTSTDHENPHTRRDRSPGRWAWRAQRAHSGSGGLGHALGGAWFCGPMNGYGAGWTPGAREGLTGCGGACAHAIASAAQQNTHRHAALPPRFCPVSGIVSRVGHRSPNFFSRCACVLRASPRPTALP